MEAIGTFLANTYGIFVVIAIFAILALIGYVVESKTGATKRIVISSSKPQNDVDSDLQKLKNDLATSNKGLNSMVGNSLGQASSQSETSNQAPNPNVINFDQVNTNANESSIKPPEKL